ncbi:serine hydrolase [Nocardia neocaledoniensis NBRC 108232]|uniref:CubicO group peptidase (Beta-lactamase class C family) n=1 Tax=Nocardia neocaledoniensis TaxID=236511 RepID=A0A317NIP6_9NOCA|nr:serine hydrolase domain-containing protein [Nocardia neocaledoniensis]PWV74514.1 CubicO group peptidase (beta-lactamase class C family) [Nocardia neocaledoniensis]GEM33155.1 serine hydrolase [Nocardia neocaledoniensis NBRC 108232]
MIADSVPMIAGTVATGFERVREEFMRNFTERGEVGAALTVTVAGKTVVDLWGGLADAASRRPWSEDTLVHVWSSTKGATALCAHLLIARGELDINAPVTRYWPEFAAAGKADVPVRYLLSHQAGLPAVREPLPHGAFYDWDLMTGALARTEPFWTPGTRHGYHGLTFGFLVGELVRRVSGQGLGDFFRSQVSDPLGLDFWLGLPESAEARVAPTIAPDFTAPGTDVPGLYRTAMAEPGSAAGLMLFNSGGYMTPGESDTRAAHAAVMGGIGGVTNARGLAGMYRPLALGGSFDGVQLVAPSQIPLMSAVESASSIDAILGVPTRFALGFVKHIDNRHLAAGDREGILLSDAAFGHAGIGGSLGFADPSARMSFGYAMNRQGSGLGVNDRGQALIDAVYRAVGYCSADGMWFRA